MLENKKSETSFKVFILKELKKPQRFWQPSSEIVRLNSLYFFPFLFFVNYVEILKMHFGFLFLESESWKSCWKVKRFSKENVIGWCAMPRGSSWKQNQMHHRFVTSCKIKGCLEILSLFFSWTNFALFKGARQKLLSGFFPLRGGRVLPNSA